MKEDFIKYIPTIARLIPHTIRFVDISGGLYTPIFHFDNLKVKTINDFGDRIVKMTMNFRENLKFSDSGEFLGSELNGEHLELFEEICTLNSIDFSDFQRAYDQVFYTYAKYQVDNKPFDAFIEIWRSSDDACTFWLCPDEYLDDSVTINTFKREIVSQTCPVLVATSSDDFDDVLVGWRVDLFGRIKLFRNQSAVQREPKHPIFQNFELI
jgi:hypothetical protein